MNTNNLLLGFLFVVYSGLLALAIIFNGAMIEAVKDIAIATIGTILGYIISLKGSIKNKQS